MNNCSHKINLELFVRLFQIVQRLSVFFCMMVFRFLPNFVHGLHAEDLSTMSIFFLLGPGGLSKRRPLLLVAIDLGCNFNINHDYPTSHNPSFILDFCVTSLLFFMRTQSSTSLSSACRLARAETTFQLKKFAIFFISNGTDIVSFSPSLCSFSYTISTIDL